MEKERYTETGEDVTRKAEDKELKETRPVFPTNR